LLFIRSLTQYNKLLQTTQTKIIHKNCQITLQKFQQQLVQHCHQILGAEVKLNL